VPSSNLRIGSPIGTVIVAVSEHTDIFEDFDTMRLYSVPQSAEDIVRWLKEESESGSLEFYVNAWKQYRLEEEFDRSKYAVEHPEDFDLVSVVAGVDVEPRVERNYWVLQVRIRDVIGLRRTSEEDAYLDEAAMNLDAFAAQFIGPSKGEISVRLLAETREAKGHFDDWFASFMAKHA
jgi:hypothetical protein